MKKSHETLAQLKARRDANKHYYEPKPTDNYDMVWLKSPSGMGMNDYYKLIEEINNLEKELAE